MLESRAIILEEPGRISVRPLALDAPKADEIVVETRMTGVSTGTERLLYEGRMPSFPGMGYPLVPGYENVGEIVEAGPDSGRRVGETVFVPGATCFGSVRGLFGAAAERLVVRGDRVQPISATLGDRGLLLALAATARHALAPAAKGPTLIVGHGVLGRLAARLIVAEGGAPPVVWETRPERASGARGYEVSNAAADGKRDYATVVDVSGDSTLLDALVQRLAPGGEIVLAGFYAKPLAFAFPPAFMREARFRIAAQWAKADLGAVARMVEEGRLALDGLVTHRRPASEAPAAYAQAFDDPNCLKMALDWSARP